MSGWLACALGAAALSWTTPDVAHGVDLRIYVADKDRKLVDPGDLEIVVHLDRPETKRKTLEMELATPKGSKRFGLGHGGQIVKADGFFVELVLFDPHKDLANEEDGTPYFRADVSLVEIPEFQAVVEFKIKGKSRKAEGFEYPVVPEAYKGAVLKLENRVSRLRSSATAGDGEAVFLAQSLIALLWDGIPDLAPDESREAVAKTCKAAKGLSQELDLSVRAADATRTAALLEKVDAAIRELKSFVK
jgi:hypothetical protein